LLSCFDEQFFIYTAAAFMGSSSGNGIVSPVAKEGDMWRGSGHVERESKEAQEVSTM
jgi:hypothetical protein